MVGSRCAKGGVATIAASMSSRERTSSRLGDVGDVPLLGELLRPVAQDVEDGDHPGRGVAG